MATYPFIFILEDESPESAIGLAHIYAEDMVNAEFFSHYIDDSSKAYEVGTPEALAFVEKVLGEQERDILDYLKKIRALMATHSDEEILNEQGTSRDPFYRVGMYRGSEVRFYDQDGVGLRTREDIMGRVNARPGGGMNMYVVEVHMHV